MLLDDLFEVSLDLACLLGPGLGFDSCRCLKVHILAGFLNPRVAKFNQIFVVFGCVTLFEFGLIDFHEIPLESVYLIFVL